MDQQVAMDLNGIMMAHQLEDQQNRLKSGINEIAAEVIRVTSVMGTAVSHLAEKAHESDQRVIEELKAWTAELQKEGVPGTERPGGTGPYGGYGEEAC